MVKKIQINMSNKSFYSLIVFGVLALVCIGVYAYGGSNPAIHGHSINELAPPVGCSAGQVLGWSGTSWQCVDNEGGEVADAGCPSGYEPFTNQISESCILKDDWSDSGSLSVPVGSHKYFASAETRMHDGKRQVRITNCGSGYGIPCTTGWSDDIASCKYFIYDVSQYGCVAAVSDRYTVRITNQNLYLDQYKLVGETFFGPGTVDTIVKYYPPYNGAGVGVDVPKGEYKGSCNLGSSGGYARADICTSATWPGKCTSNGKGCECESGYRMVEPRLTSWRANHYECVKE